MSTRPAKPNSATDAGKPPRAATAAVFGDVSAQVPAPVYLDYAATSPIRPEVLEALRQVFTPGLSGDFGNPSSVHWAGRTARRTLEEARTRLAESFRRRPSDIVFTSGATEADNLALFGVMMHASTRSRRLVVSAVEHPAVVSAADRLESMGYEVVRIPVDEQGLLDLDALDRELRTTTRLVSVMAVNNETGVISPLEEVSRLARERGALLHVDAAQALGKIELPLNADLISLSSHKVGGLKGSGALVLREQVGLAPQILGGPQERGHRAGTENVAAAVALAAAVAAAELERAAENDRLGALQRELETRIGDLPGTLIVGARAARVATTTTVVFDDVEGDALLQALDLEAIAASSGSACSSGSLEPSHVLLAMGFSPTRARQAVRFSLGWASRPSDVERLFEVLPGLLERVRRNDPPRTNTGSIFPSE